MRILEVILEGGLNLDKIAVIGDSIAVGIKGAGGVSAGTAVGGSNTSKVLGFVKDFVSSGKVKGYTVILSSGAANSSKVVDEDGKTVQSENFAPVSAQIKLLKDAGATVALVGVASEKTPQQKPTKFTNGKKWVIDYTGVNSQLAAIASSSGAKFLGPLEKYDNTMSQHDGIHPFNGYSKLFSAGAAYYTEPDDKADKKNKQDAAPTGTTSTFVVPVPGGRRGAAVADVQKALVALGYDIGPHGVDGVRGPYTSAAVKKLQAQLGVTVDGDPGPETVAALNKLLISKPELTAKLSNSKETDVKGPDYSAGAGQYAGLANDENAQKAQSASEKFLGRKIDSDEWNYLVRGIYAEATSNQKEIAYVAAVMLNRTRSGKWGRSIISVLRAPNQFQSVTGTRADGHSASRNFTQGPGAGSLGNIYKALIDILPHAPTDILRFTAANRKAYGAGTNVGYLDQLVAQGGQQIGGTVFA
jgi:hypothetical protein